MWYAVEYVYADNGKDVDFLLGAAYTKLEDAITAANALGRKVMTKREFDAECKKYDLI